MTDEASIKAALSNYKGQCTAEANKFHETEALGDAHGASKTLVSLYQSHLEKYTQKADNLNLKYQELMEFYDDNSKKAESKALAKEWKTNSDICDKVLHDITVRTLAAERAVRDFQEQLQAGGLAAAAPAPNPAPVSSKVDTYMKPEKVLSLNSSPSEYSVWKKNFTSFYNSNDGNSKPIETQRSLLDKNFNVELRERLDSSMDANLPIFSANIGDDSCFKFLDSLWEELFPLPQRRQQFFDSKFKASGRYSTYMTHLETLSREANLQACTAEEFLVYKFISDSSPYPALQKLLREIRNPTHQKINEVVKQYEIYHSTEPRVSKISPIKFDFG